MLYDEVMCKATRITMSENKHEGRVETEKCYTNYKWVLNDWALLYDYYYTPTIKSPEFEFANTRGCKCQITLEPVVNAINSNNGTVEIVLHGMADFIMMKIAMYAIYPGAKKLLSLQTLSGKNVTYPITKSFSPCLRNVDTFLTKGAMILLFEFTIIKSLKTFVVSTKNITEKLSTNVRAKLRQLRKSDDFRDVTFAVGDKKFYAHKVILAANSKYFEAMFTSGMKEQKEGTVEILDTDATVFKEFLDYMYTGKVANLEQLVEDLIIAADKYQYDELKDFCENFMSSNLDDANAIKYLVVAHKHSCSRLKAELLCYVKRSSNTLGPLDDYKMLFDYPELIQEIFNQT